MDNQDQFKKKEGRAKQQIATKKKIWYVNVDQNMNSFNAGNVTFPAIVQQDGYGPKMPIEAILVSNNSKKQFESKWALESEGNNTDVKITGPAIQKAALEFEKKKEEHDANKRFFTNSLTLPDIGGDKHTVTCTKVNATTRNREILQVEIETWRKLWVTIYWTDNTQQNIINDIVDAIKSSFAKAQIEFIHVPAQAKLNWDHHFYSITSSTNLQEDFVRAMHGGNWPALQRKPFHLQIVLVKSCVRLKEMTLKFKVVPTVSEADGYKLEGNTLTVKLPKEMKFLLNNNLLAQVARLRLNYQFFNSIKAIKYTPNTQPQATIIPTVNNVNYVAWQSFSVDTTGAIEQALKAGAVDFEFTVEVVDKCISGENKGNKIVIETHELKEGNLAIIPKESIAHVIIHEIGHALDLVPDSNAFWTHKDQYRDHGGTGPHCKYNAALDLQNIYRYGGQGKMCIMYHGVHDQAGPDFCENCLKYLKFIPLRLAQLNRPGQLGGWTFSA